MSTDQFLKFLVKSSQPSTTERQTLLKKSRKALNASKFFFTYKNKSKKCINQNQTFHYLQTYMDIYIDFSSINRQNIRGKVVKTWLIQARSSPVPGL